MISFSTEAAKTFSTMESQQSFQEPSIFFIHTLITRHLISQN